MTAALCQMFLGGALLAFAVWMKLHDIRRVLRMLTARSPVKDWIEIPTPIILGIFAVALIVDPLIPGVAGLTVHVPIVQNAYSGLPEQLLKEGAVGLIGAQIDVPAVFAVEYAKEILTGFLARTAERVRLGPLMREVNQKLWDVNRNPLGFVYSLYRGVDCFVDWEASDGESRYLCRLNLKRVSWLNVIRNP